MVEKVSTEPLTIKSLSFLTNQSNARFDLIFLWTIYYFLPYHFQWLKKTRLGICVKWGFKDEDFGACWKYSRAFNSGLYKSGWKNKIFSSLIQLKINGNFKRLEKCFYHPISKNACKCMQMCVCVCECVCVWCVWVCVKCIFGSLIFHIACTCIPNLLRWKIDSIKMK